MELDPDKLDPDVLALPEPPMPCDECERARRISTVSIGLGMPCDECERARRISTVTGVGLGIGLGIGITALILRNA